jgi:hypothetical protein
MCSASMKPRDSAAVWHHGRMRAPDEIVEVPGQPHTFGLANARDMLRKLEWEVAEIERHDSFTAYRAFNAAVTAWHLVDWVWRDLVGSGQRRPSDTKDAFQRRCEAVCPELKLCGLIANASKHGGHDRRRSAGAMSTVLLADVVRAKAGAMRAGDPLATWTWRLIIRDGEQERTAADVFARTLPFWRELIDRELPVSQ